MRRQQVHNVVWLTADIFCAAGSVWARSGPPSDPPTVGRAMNHVTPLASTCGAVLRRASAAIEKCRRAIPRVPRTD